MTAPAPSDLKCPNCGSVNVQVGASGNAICPDCSHLFDPANPTLAPPPPLAPFAMAPVDDVYGPADALARADTDDDLRDVDGLAWARTAGNPETYADRLAELEGGTAVLEGGQVTTVVAFTSRDEVVVMLGSGDTMVVSVDDVERIMPPVVVPVPVDVPADVVELPAEMRLALSLARIIIRAGCESVNGTGADVTPGVPPVGYLPADADLHAVIERAAGLAVGMLIEVFELDVDAILEWVGAIDDNSGQGDPTTGEHDGEEHTGEA